MDEKTKEQKIKEIMDNPSGCGKGCLGFFVLLVIIFIIAAIYETSSDGYDEEQLLTNEITKHFPSVHINELEYFVIDSAHIDLQHIYADVSDIRVPKPKELGLYRYRINEVYRGTLILYDNTFYPSSFIPKNLLFEDPESIIRFKLKDMTYFENDHDDKPLIVEMFCVPEVDWESFTKMK